MKFDALGAFFVVPKGFVLKPFNLTISKYRILMLAFSNINVVGQEIEINLNDYKEVFGKRKDISFNFIEKSINELKTSEYLCDDDGYIYTWLVGSKIIDDKTVRIKLNPYLSETVKCYFDKFNENGGYAKIHFKNIAKLSSFFALRLYQCLVLDFYKSEKKQDGYRHIKLNLDVLKSLTSSDAKYKVWSDFYKKQLLIAESQINSLTNLEMQMTPVKIGRSVNSVIFKVRYK